MARPRIGVLTLVLAAAALAGCTPDPGPEVVPLSYLTLEDLELGETVTLCDATEFPAVIGTYEVSNSVPSDTGRWQYYVGAVALQPVTGMYDLRFRDNQDYSVQLGPGESALIEIVAIEPPVPGTRVEFNVAYHFVPAAAADADADARLSTSYTTELGQETVEFVWDCE